MSLHSHKVDSEELLACWPGIEAEITAHCEECNPDYVPFRDRQKKPNLDVPPPNRLSIEAAERVNSRYAPPPINTDLTAIEHQQQMAEWLRLQAESQQRTTQVQLNQYSSGLNSPNIVTYDQSGGSNVIFGGGGGGSSKTGSN